jgi:hypothetical protein
MNLAVVSQSQHCSTIPVNNKTLPMKTAILIILMTISTAAFSQNPARKDSVVDAIIKSKVLRIPDSSACNHVFTRYCFEPYSGVDTLSINSFSQQWLWNRQCSVCGTYETQSRVFYWRYAIKEE